ncbi:MAG: DUF4435 domain-containing protein [Prevotellaceae bacterium]|nr:DUF4435 domain-containing protein [Prevotellaceae bacterium]
MNKRLRDNISSDYVSAANRLKSKKARRRIVAYVESYDDVLFWRTILADFEDETRYFEVMLPSRNNLERGKRSALNMLISSKNIGQDLIACVDADYDYLMQGATQTSHEIITNPYVFHTYAYAIENLQCYAPSLHNVCVMVTLNDHSIFDFNDFFRQYSEAIFPLFVWSIWHYRQSIYGQFTITDFDRVVELGGFSVTSPDECLNNLRAKVTKKTTWLRQRNPNAKQSYLAVKNDLMRLGVTPQTTYLYIQGHHLFSKIVVPIVSKVCDRLVRERENEIRKQSVHSTQMRNELSCYSHSIQDITQMLKKNFGYVASEAFKRMHKDIEEYLGIGKDESQTDVE